MNGKLNIEAVLKEWPSPSGEDHIWEQRAEAIVKAAMARSSSATSDDKAKAEALTAPPALPPEPGEPGGRTSLPGEIKMSDEQSGGSSSQKPASNPPRKKQSLKEIAERASQSGMSRPSGAPSSMAGSSRPSTSTPIPSAPLSNWDTAERSTSTPIPSARPSGALSTPLPSARPSMPLSSRPIEAGRDDSGIVDLNTMRASVTAQEKAAAEKAKPATHGLIEDDEHEAAPRAVARPALAAVPAKKKGSGGAIAGIAVAVLGLAAAFAVVMISNKNPGPQATVAVPETPKADPAGTDEQPVAAKPEAPAEAPAAPESTAAPEAPTTPQAVAQNDPARPAGPMPTAPEAPGAPPAETGKTATPAAPAPGTTGTPGNLNEAITKRMGGESGGTAEEKAEPASGPGGKSKGSSVPEQPPQGSVQAAIGSVMGGAKGCVAGADDVSRAQITFSSSGTVSNVSVSGWAASKGAAGCIKAALKGANVGAFSKPTYTVGITIRP